MSTVTVLLLCNQLQQASNGGLGVELTSGDNVYSKQSPALVLLGPLLVQVGVNYAWSNQRCWWALALWKSCCPLWAVW